MRVSFLAVNKNPKFFRKDPSYIYRCESVGLALSDLGVNTTFHHLKQHSLATFSELVVFHRPRFSIRLLLTIYWLQFQGCRVIADFDDLVFDKSYSEWSPGVVNGVLSTAKTQKNFHSHYKALQYFDLVTVSTVPLQEHIHRLYPGKRVVVLPNTIHTSWRRQFDHIPIADTNFERPIITYLPGTRSHDRDFHVFAVGLSKFLNDHPHVSLQVTGPLKFDLPVRSEQVIHHEKVPFARYHEQIKTAWVNLAPLEITPFTRCKSALKVIEASYWGRPTLCSLIPDAERLIGCGAIPVDSDEDLYSKLVELLDPVSYQKTVSNLRNRIVALSDVSKSADFLSQLVTID